MMLTNSAISKIFFKDNLQVYQKTAEIDIWPTCLRKIYTFPFPNQASVSTHAAAAPGTVTVRP